MNTRRRILLANASIATSEEVRQGTLLIEDGIISEIWKAGDDGMTVFEGIETEFTAVPELVLGRMPDTEIRDLSGKVLMAGGIDAHVHFREPGMTVKADIASESRAALLGGVTSFIDMPNTNPPTVSIGRVREKFSMAEGHSYANWGFHIGATNDNLEELAHLADSAEGEEFGGIKVFMGSSTGNMLVDREKTLEGVFGMKNVRIPVHCEDEGIIRANLEAAKEKFGDAIPIREHENIRSRQACIRSTVKALQMAMEHGTKLHITHVTTAEEVDMIRTAKRYNPGISAETSANYLWFSDEDYEKYGSRIKCNPAVKAPSDRAALRKALAEGVIDSIGSDHAPHLPEEKARPYTSCPSGMPSIQQSIAVVLTVAAQEGIPLTRIAAAISEKPAELYGIKNRGRLQKGYAADIIVIDMQKEFTVSRDGSGPGGIAYKCGWSPYEGTQLKGYVEDVYLNGLHVVSGGRLKDSTPHGVALAFEK
ncbi:MAG: amidohydrolase family protein [Candidatus Cryptobacteroides sp.]